MMVPDNAACIVCGLQPVNAFRTHSIVPSAESRYRDVHWIWFQTFHLSIHGQVKFTSCIHLVLISHASSISHLHPRCTYHICICILVYIYIPYISLPSHPSMIMTADRTTTILPLIDNPVHDLPPHPHLTFSNVHHRLSTHSPTFLESHCNRFPFVIAQVTEVFHRFAHVLYRLHAVDLPQSPRHDVTIPLHDWFNQRYLKLGPDK